MTVAAKAPTTDAESMPHANDSDAYSRAGVDLSARNELLTHAYANLLHAHRDHRDDLPVSPRR